MVAPPDNHGNASVNAYSNLRTEGIAMPSRHAAVMLSETELVSETVTVSPSLVTTPPQNCLKNCLKKVVVAGMVVVDTTAVWVSHLSVDMKAVFRRVLVFR